MIHHRNMPGHPEYQRQRLEQATHQLGLNQGEHQKTQMLQLLQELMRWNKTYNLTAIRDSDQALVHHLFDSLSVVKPLQEYLHETSKISAPKGNIVGAKGKGGKAPPQGLIEMTEWAVHTWPQRQFHCGAAAVTAAGLPRRGLGT